MREFHHLKFPVVNQFMVRARCGVQRGDRPDVQPQRAATTATPPLAAHKMRARSCQPLLRY